MAVRKKPKSQSQSQQGAWEPDYVVTTKRAMNAWGEDWPAGTELIIATVRDFAVEVQFPSGYVGTVLKQDVVLTSEKRVMSKPSNSPAPKAQQAPAPTEPARKTPKERALERKQRGIAIAESAARIMEESKRKRAEGAEEKVVRTRVRKERAADTVSLKEICRSLDAEPRVVRRLLRNAKNDALQRAEGRWEWPKADAERVTAAIRQLLAAAEA